MRIPIALYVLALVARLVTAALFPDPAYPDSFYYVDVARQLAAGHGFNVDFIWIFPEVGGAIPANPVLPIPSNAHWMPLASLVQVPFIWLLGPDRVASALPFALAGAFAAPLDLADRPRRRARRRSSRSAPASSPRSRRCSLVYMVQPDNFSLYQPLVAGALWLAARGLRGEPRAFVARGAAGRDRDALAQRRRARARRCSALRLAVGPLADADLVRRRRAATRPDPVRSPRSARSPLFALVVGPWYARQLATFGSLSPSTASGKVLFIRDIGEWNSITIPANLDHLLGQGLGPLLADAGSAGSSPRRSSSRSLVGVLVLVPFMLVGAWAPAARRRLRAVLRATPCLLFAFRAIVSAVHVPGGTFIHSAVALAPHGYILAL